MSLKVCVAQIRSKPGQIEVNKSKILEYIEYAKKQKQNLIVFPELALTGYLCLDLFLSQSFLESQNKALYEIIENSKGITIILGFVDFFVLNQVQKEFYFSGTSNKSKQEIFEQSYVNLKSQSESQELDSYLLSFNAAIVIRNQKIIKIVHKTNLPSYDIFDENRYFRSKNEFNLQKILNFKNPKNISNSTKSQSLLTSLNYSKSDIQKIYNQKPFVIKKINLGITICEDIWDENYFYKPSQNLNLKNPGILINLSHSPFWTNKDKERQQTIQNLIQKTRKTLIFANGVGAFDGYDGQIIFDGKSCIYNKKAEIFEQAKAFKEDLIFVEFNLDNQTNFSSNVTNSSHIILKKQELFDFKNSILNSNSNYLEQNLDFKKNWEILQALVLGISEYLRLSTNNIETILLGISGGIDSALVATLTTLAIKNLENIKLIGVMMPSEFTSNNSLDYAYKLAKNLKFELLNIPIKNLLQTSKNQILESLESESSLKSISTENLQARIRSNILMTLSNHKNGLVLATSNKTEAALGYTTLYGDMSGGLAPILDLDKLEIYELAKFLNQNWKFINAWDFSLDKNLDKNVNADILKKADLLPKILEQETPKTKKNRSKNQFFEEIIPLQIIDRKPTAELASDQTDEASFGMSYKSLVPLVNEIVENPNFSLESFLYKIENNLGNLKNLDLKKEDYLPEMVFSISKKIKQNEFKRRQAAPGIKIAKKSFGFGRRQIL